MMATSLRVPTLGLLALLCLSASVLAQPGDGQVQGVAAPGDGERFRAELLTAAAALAEVESLTGRSVGGIDPTRLTARIQDLDADALATVREAVVQEVPAWASVVANLSLTVTAAVAEERSTACASDLDYGDLCGTPASTGVRQGLQDAWYVLDIAALTAQGICDAAPSGDVNVINTVVCPVAAVLKLVARYGQFLYDLFQFCADEGTAVTVDAAHCHLDDEFRFTDNDELAAQTTVLLAKMQEILDQLSGLQRATCDVSRLVTTPSGLRYSDIDVCQGEPGWPYDWPRNGVGVGSLGAEAAPAATTSALELEAHVARGTLLPTLYLPAAAGGALEQVRELVGRTISSQERIGYAPEETAEARSLLEAADRLAGERDYVGAYRGYSEAYRALIPTAGGPSASAPDADAPSLAPEVDLAPLGEARLPTAPGLGAVVPNPVTGTLRYSVRLPAETLVTVRVYSVDGRLVRTLVDGSLPAGATVLSWDSGNAGSRLANGVYFLRLDAAGVRESRKFVVTR